jgi:Flp pilus assembly protein TadD
LVKYYGADHSMGNAYEQALHLMPQLKVARGNLAQALDRAGRYADATRALEQTASSAQVPAAVSADTLLQLGQLDEAIAAYRTDLRADPRSVRALTSLGFALIRAGHLQWAHQP